MMLRTSALAAMLALATAQAQASVITDPAGDFLPSFAGAPNPDLDVLSASASDSNGSFRFGAVLAGTVGSTPGALYVFGIDRGQGTVRFGALAPGVLFDSVVSVTPNAATVVRDLLSGLATTLPASATTLSGNSLTVVVPEALLPSTGFGVAQYTVNLWPRLGAGNNNQISDFAPDNSNFGVTVPEPASLALLGFGIAGLAGLRRRAT